MYIPDCLVWAMDEAVSYTHLDVYKRQAKEYGKMKTIVSTSLISFLLLSIILGIFGFCFSHAMMSGLQTPADILEEAVLLSLIHI